MVSKTLPRPRPLLPLVTLKIIVTLSDMASGAKMPTSLGDAQKTSPIIIIVSTELS